MRTCRGLIVLGLVLLAIQAALPRPAGAQSSGDWTAPYAPALLPAFVGDMAAFAQAPRYTLDLAIVPGDEEATVSGHETVTYTNRLSSTALDEIVFRLYPNLEGYGGTMEVSGVQADSAAVDPRLDSTRTVLTVPLSAPLEPGDSVTLAMDFTATATAEQHLPYTQFSFLKEVLALPDAYPVLAVYEPGSGWAQVTDNPHGDAVYSETSFFTASVTAPADLILAASGSEVDLETHDDGTLTHHYVAPLMREFTLVGSTRYVVLSGEQDGVAINLYYDPKLPEALANARAGLEWARDAVRVYNQDFGRYPFAELDFMQTPTTAGGIEYPGLIVVTDETWDRRQEFFEFVIAHEAAHQWWYSLVGNDQTVDPWMDESLAQYATALYIGALEGEPSYEAALDSYRQQYERFAARSQAEDTVIGEPSRDYSDSAYFYIVYQKGPLFFAALADEYGQEALLGALQDYFAAYRYRVAEPRDMLDSFEQSLKADLDPLFEEWVGSFPVG